MYTNEMGDNDKSVLMKCTHVKIRVGHCFLPDSRDLKVNSSKTLLGGGDKCICSVSRGVSINNIIN